MEKIILASKSPYRKKLMDDIGIPYDIVVSNADETPIESFSFREQLKEISMRKALTVFEMTKTAGNRIIIAAEQNIVFHGVMLGKPQSIEEAREYIKDMEGSDKIYACTGNTILHIKDNKIITCINECDIAKMKLAYFPDEILADYLSKSSPLTKCGGISILDTPALELIEGNISTAIGLTIEYVKEMLTTIS